MPATASYIIRWYESGIVNRQKDYNGDLAFDL